MIQSTRLLELDYAGHTLCDETNEIIEAFFNEPTRGVSDTTLLYELGLRGGIFFTGARLKEHYEEVNSNPARSTFRTPPRRLSQWTKFQKESQDGGDYRETILAVEKGHMELEDEICEMYDRNEVLCVSCAEYQECDYCINPARISPQRLAAAIAMYRRIVEKHNGEKDFVLGYLQLMRTFVVIETEAPPAKQQRNLKERIVDAKNATKASLFS